MPLNRYFSMSMIYPAAGLLILIYTIAHAAGMGITYDEAWTIRSFVPQSFMHIVNYTPCDANSHMLNTLLIKLMFLFGDDSVFMARVPNILAGILYVWFCSRITREFLSPAIGICCFLLLVCNPFLLDFFSLARGYGLAIAFQSGALYFLLRYVRDHRQNDASKALISGGLAVLSGFSLLNFWLVVFGIVTVLPFLYRKLYSRKRIFWNFIIAFGLLALVWEPLRKLNKSGSLWYGGNVDFYHDTLTSLTKYSFGYNSDEYPWVFNALNGSLVVLTLVIIAAFVFNRRLHTQRNVLLATLLLCITAVLMQHFLLGTLYVIDRTALYFFPLFILVLCFSLEEFSGKWYAKAIAMAVAALFVVNLVAKANFYKSAIWYFDAHSETILDDLERQGKKQNAVLRVKHSWVFISSFTYYLDQKHYRHIELVTDVGQEDTLQPDYYVYLEKPLEHTGYQAAGEPAAFPRKQAVRRFPEEFTTVYRIDGPAIAPKKEEGSGNEEHDH
jgi:hypothetical protein